MKNVWVSWSTGKDSAFTLYELSRRSEFRVTGLFTTITEPHARVSMHATREELLHRQAHELGLPLETVPIPSPCSNEVYESRMSALIAKAKASGVEAMAFGDLYLKDVRAYREEALKGSGIEPVFPLWGRSTAVLADEMMLAGIGAVLTCVDPRKLDPAFAGRCFDTRLLAELPADVDPCGENGEFHTFVFRSPNFRSVVDFELGETVERDGFVFRDVRPA